MSNFIIQLLVLSSTISLGAGETLTEFHVNGTHLEQPRNFPCPNPADIAPCNCIYDSDSGRLTLDCTDITSDEELADILANYFPVNDFYEFRMNSSSALTALNFACGGVKFRRFDLSPGPFPLVEVGYLFYESCSSSDLEYVRFRDTELSTLVFPPPPLSDKITDFDMGYSNLASVPPISSDSLSFLELAISEISVIKTGTFDEIPNLSRLYLQFNSIKVLESGSIPLTSSGWVYNLNYNAIETIEPGAFYVKGEPNVNFFIIELQFNRLKTIDFSVFGALMPYTRLLFINGNPLDCGCDLAWIILNPEYMEKIRISSPTCADGTLLTDLDPAPFEQFC